MLGALHRDRAAAPTRGLPEDSLSRQVAFFVLALLSGALAPVAGRSSAPGGARVQDGPACCASGAPVERRAPVLEGSDEFVDVDEMPAAVSAPAPALPEAARAAGVSGTLFVRAHVDARGQVDATEKERALPSRLRGRPGGRALAQLEAAAREAVRGWTFRPARCGGRAVPAWITVPVTFRDDCAGAGTTGRCRPRADLPTLLTWVEPVYPYVARCRGICGTVVVRALVGADGRVRDARIAASVPGLDRAALTAVRKWTFTPARAAGRAVEAWLDVPVRFPSERGRLRGAAPFLRRLGGPLALGGEAEPLS